MTATSPFSDLGLAAEAGKRLVQISLMVAVQAVCLFLAAGGSSWKWAWFSLGIYLAGISINRIKNLSEKYIPSGKGRPDLGVGVAPPPRPPNLALSATGSSVLRIDTKDYFSPVVRVETEGGKRVCRAGPYRFKRHPGYAGAILQEDAPLMLSSSWAAIPAALPVVLKDVRTALEDQILLRELLGSPENTCQVRYRLLSGVR